MDLIRNSKIIDIKYREFFLPTILTALSTSLIIMADGVLVGNLLGANEFAAVNLCIPVIQVFGMISELLGMGGSAIISVARGRRENQKANQAFTAVLLLFAVSCLILMTPQVLAMPFFSSLVTQDPILYPFVYEYYSILIWAAPFALFVQATEYIIRAEGRPRMASFITVFANVVNILLDVVFMGVLDMGLGGAALATVIGFGVASALSLGTLIFGTKTLQLCFQNLWICCLDIIKTGLPAAMGVGLIAIKLFCLNHIVMATAGNNGMVAFSICLATLSLCTMFITAAAQTMMPILGIYYGEQDWTGARLVLKRTFQIMVLCSLVLTLFLEAAPEAILFLYGVNEAETVAVALPALRIYAISLVGVSVSFLMMYYYMAVEKPNLANMISILNGVVFIIPCAYVLSKVMGITGVWLSFPLAELLTLFYIWVMAKGKMSNVYQISDEEAAILDISLLGKEDMGAAASRQAMDFLEAHGMEHKLSNKIGIAIEEMVENIYRYFGGKKVHIDLRLVANKEGVVLSFCDDGPEFDPTTYQPEEKDEFAIDNILMLRAVSKDIKYQRVIGLNKTLVYF